VGSKLNVPIKPEEPPILIELPLKENEFEILKKRKKEKM
jgi:hypothetical protein